MAWNWSNVGSKAICRKGKSDDHGDDYVDFIDFIDFTDFEDDGALMSHSRVRVRTNKL